MALVLKSVADKSGDYEVMKGEWQVGEIERRLAIVGLGERWFWTLNRVPDGPENMVIAGMAGTLGDAEAELRKSWEQWLEWAGLTDP